MPLADHWGILLVVDRLLRHAGTPFFLWYAVQDAGDMKTASFPGLLGCRDVDIRLMLAAAPPPRIRR